MHESKKFLLVIPILLIAGLAYLAWIGWRNTEDAGYESCLASVMSNLHQDLGADIIVPKNYANHLPNTGKWKILTPAEVDDILAQTHGTDCGRTHDITLDLWGRKVNVALRRFESRNEVVIWSNGSDGKSGTSDDLVAPWGHEIPKE